ncbi:unnamed protein product, partial [Rotaria sp. Silwood2]
MVRMTPLDFRVTAAAQFRLLAMACSISMVSIDNLNKIYGKEYLVNAKALSPVSLQDQANALIEKFNAAMKTKVTPIRGYQFLRFIISQDYTDSSLHTNTLLTSVPGSDIFKSIINFYPKRDNVTYSS